MKKLFIICILLVSFGILKSQTISVSDFSLAFTYRQLYPDGEYVKNSTLPNYDIRWRVEFFPQKKWRISMQPGFFSRLYSLHDEMYDNSFTSKRFICPAISLNFEKHFKSKEGLYQWAVFGGATISNQVEGGVEWRSFKWLDWIDFTPYSYNLQIGGMYHLREKCSFFAQFNYPWIRNLNYLPINVGLGSHNTPGAYLSTPTLGNERWSITAGVVWKVFNKKDE
jgi:hypothetical protein